MKYLFLVLMLLAITASAAGQTVEKSVVGTWKLVAYEDMPRGGVTIYPWGTDPSGLLMYDETGNMAVQIQRTPLVKLSSHAESSVKPIDKQRLLDSYTAYFGSYMVDWDKMTITHHVAGNLFPFYNGTDQMKSFEISDNRLTLKVSWTENGKQWSGIRIFERLKKPN